MKKSRKNTSDKIRRARVTWRLDPSNYDFVNDERKRMGLTSMNAALNVVLAEHRHRCRHFGVKWRPV